jgi:rhodanese-related sulfurtransferase
VKQVLIEGILVAAVGAVLAFAANGLSPRGLKLSRNYFPKTESTLPAPGRTNLPVAAAITNLGATSTNQAATATNPAVQLQLLAARLQQHGLRLADSNQVIRLYHDPRRLAEQVVFIDARNDQHYQEGHVPGAWLFDYYRPENYLAAVLPACQVAEQIVIYCNGGGCEDSELAALLLAGAVPKDKMSVYGGGFTEWNALKLPVEIGARNSGTLRNVK